MKSFAALVVQRVVVTAWVGAMWTVGFVVAPTLFAALEDRRLAGEVAGRLFSDVSYLGISCAVLLLVMAVWRRGSGCLRLWGLWILVAMLAITLVSQFVVTPAMVAVKASVGPDHGRFATLHVLSSSLYVVNCLLGLVLVARGGVENGGAGDGPRH